MSEAEHKSRDSMTRCRFCRDRMGDVDYKDVSILNRLVSAQGKIFSRRRSGVCSPHQRALQRAVKNARYLGLIPYTG